MKNRLFLSLLALAFAGGSLISCNSIGTGAVAGGAAGAGAGYLYDRHDQKKDTPEETYDWNKDSRNRVLGGAALGALGGVTVGAIANDKNHPRNQPAVAQGYAAPPANSGYAPY